MITLSKLATLIIWLVILTNWLSPFSEPTHSYLHWLGLILVSAHAIEVLLYRPLIKQTHGRHALHYLQVLIFGGAHCMRLRQSSLQQSPLRPSSPDQPANP